MKHNKNNIEKLLLNLPDYLTGNLDDKNLINEIESELNTNPEFKNEFEEIKNTFNFLNNTEFDTPSDVYFQNLSVKINSKIQSETKSFWSKIPFIWKIAVPACTIIIISIIYISNQSLNENNIGNNIISSDSNINNYSTILDSNSKINNQNSENKFVVKENVNTQTSETEKINSNSNAIRNKTINNTKNLLSKQNSKSNKESNDLFASNDIDIYSNETAEENSNLLLTGENESVLDSPDYDQLEEEFDKLSEEEKKEILDNLFKEENI